MKKSLFSLMMAIVLSMAGIHSINATNVVVSGVISSDSTWSTDTVTVTGTVVIDSFATLTITPGTVITFDSSYCIDVMGTIIAEGTQSDTILFTATDTAGFSTNTHYGWNGIRFNITNDDADSSKFKYCKMQYGFAKGAFPADNGGAVFIEQYDKVTIDHCTFIHNTADAGGAIHTKEANLKLTNSYFAYNSNNAREGGALNFAGSGSKSTLYLANCIFEHNFDADYGGGARIRCSGNSMIRNNIFRNNKATKGGGLLLGGDPDSTIVINNIFINNEATGGGGIRTAGNSTPILINNLSANNYASDNGGGIQVGYRSDPIIINNTIVNNLANAGGGMFFSCSTDSAKIYNSVIYGNYDAVGKNQVFFMEVDSAYYADFYNCVIEGDSSAFDVENDTIFRGQYIGCFDSLPEFVNPITDSGIVAGEYTADWRLKAVSDLINAGDTANISSWITNKDLAGKQRIVDSTIEIGAYEFAQLTSLELVSPGDIDIDDNDVQINFNYTPADLVNPGITWSITDGTGSGIITQAGIFNPSSKGTVTIGIAADDDSGLNDSEEISITGSSGGSVTVHMNSDEPVNVYPNPVKDYLTIANNTDGKLNIQLISNMGSIVKQQLITGNTATINVSDLTSGLYIVKITEDKSFKYFKILKK